MDVKQYIEDAIGLKIYKENIKYNFYDSSIQSGLLEVRHTKTLALSSVLDQKVNITQDEVAQFCEQLLEMTGLGWQPIESAEKIIEKPLLLTNGITIRTGYWNGEKWLADGMSDASEYPATHWRPQPQPPKVTP